MSHQMNAQDATGILVNIPNVGILEAYGTALPQDGTPGYLPECMFTLLGGPGGPVYYNQGTEASCQFRAALAPLTLAQMINLPLNEFRVPSSGAILGSAAAGVLGLVMGTFGTAVPSLVSETANNTSKTDLARSSVQVPTNFNPGGALSIVVNALSSAALTVSGTVAIQAYKASTAGVLGSALVAGGAQTISPTAADYTFALTTTTINPGDQIDFEITTVANDTGGSSNKTISVNSVRLLADLLG
jgi:hypothetical protein